MPEMPLEEYSRRGDALDSLCLDPGPFADFVRTCCTPEGGWQWDRDPDGTVIVSSPERRTWTLASTCGNRDVVRGDYVLLTFADVATALAKGGADDVSYFDDPSSAFEDLMSRAGLSFATPAP